MPRSSLAKQSAIARAFDLGARNVPGYKEAIFAAHQRLTPEIVDAAKAKNYDDLLKASYGRMAKETSDQFDHLPLKYSFHRSGEGDYPTSREMLHDLHNNHHLFVFQGGDPHEMLNDHDPRTGLTGNEKFRAVHDAFGHGILGNTFGPQGEERAWGVHSHMYSPLARLAMSTETRGQNSYINYSPLNAELLEHVHALEAHMAHAMKAGNRDAHDKFSREKSETLKHWKFAPQKALLLPPEMVHPGYKGEMPEYIRKLERPQHAMASDLTHYSPKRGLTELGPAKFGTGLRGDEYSRVRGSQNSMKHRSYYYLGNREVEPERGVGNNSYLAHSDRLYDMSKDPHGFFRLANESNRESHLGNFNPGMVYHGQARSDVERMAYEHGYSGVANPKAQYPMAALFEKLPLHRDAGGRATIGEPDAPPITFRGKEPAQFGPEDWRDFGEEHGVPTLGPDRPKVFAKGLEHVKTRSGRVVTIPGGVKNTAPFSYHDLLHLKSQGIDPNDLDPETHKAIHHRIINAMQSGPEGPSDTRVANGMLMGLISPNQPLTANELAVARAMIKNKADLHRLAEMNPVDYKQGDMPLDQRHALSRQITRKLGLQADEHGGIGASGSADYANISQFAQKMRDRPDFYRFDPNRYPGVTPAEKWAQHVTRVYNETNGLGPKTASFASVWQDPKNAAISAIDRHMATMLRDKVFSNDSERSAWQNSVIGQFNKDRGTKLKTITEMLGEPGGKGFFVDKIFGLINMLPSVKMRSGKTGEYNKYLPTYLHNVKWVSNEPNNVQMISHPYTRALEANDAIARENGQGLFANQWMLWDRIRKRLEPHEVMFPGLENLPRMGLGQVRSATKTHSSAGYMKPTGAVGSVENPSSLAHFASGGLAGGDDGDDPYAHLRDSDPETSYSLNAPSDSVRIPKPIQLYHGSTKTFNQFNNKYIGSENGLLYGHGHYLTDDPKTANIYAQYPKSEKRLGQRGPIYNVNTHLTPDDFLDWDKAMRDQHPNIQKRMSNHILDHITNKDMLTGRQMHGSLLSRAMKSRAFDDSKKAVAEALQTSGIHGIRYRGGFSPGNNRKRVTNYVVFDPRHLEIAGKFADGGEVYHGYEPRKARADGGGANDYAPEINQALQSARQVSPSGFYSQGANAAANLARPKGTVGQLTSLLRGQGVKGEELKHSGVADMAPGDKTDAQTLHRAFQSRMPDIVEHLHEPKYSQFTMPGGENYRELLLKMNDPSKNYETLHWPGHKNVLAHLRMKDRVDEEGKKVLHLEELQSDWGQAKRHDNNRRDKIIPDGPFINNTNDWVDLGLKRALTEAARTGADKLAWTPGADQAKRFDIGNEIGRLEYKLHPYYAHKNKLTAYGHEGETLYDSEVGPEGLLDLIGKEHTDKLLATKPLAKHYYPADKYGTEIAGHHSWSPDDAHELGNKHINSHRYSQIVDYNTLPTHVLAGDGLTMGGEGMKGFYDKIMPSRLMALAKKLDPEAKMGKSWVPDAGKHKAVSFGTDQYALHHVIGENNEKLSQHKSLYEAQQKAKQLNFKELPHLEITPKMREHILTKGLPMYRRGGGVQGYAKGGAVVDRALRVARGYGGLTLDQYLQQMGQLSPVQSQPASNGPTNPSQINSFVSGFGRSPAVSGVASYVAPYAPASADTTAASPSPSASSSSGVAPYLGGGGTSPSNATASMTPSQAAATSANGGDGMPAPSGPGQSSAPASDANTGDADGSGGSGRMAAPAVTGGDSGAAPASKPAPVSKPAPAIRAPQLVVSPVAPTPPDNPPDGLRQPAAYSVAQMSGTENPGPQSAAQQAATDNAGKLAAAMEPSYNSNISNSSPTSSFAQPQAPGPVDPSIAANQKTVATYADQPAIDNAPPSASFVRAPDIASTWSGNITNSASPVNTLANAMRANIADPEATTTPGYTSSAMQTADISANNAAQQQNNAAANAEADMSGMGNFGALGASAPSVGDASGASFGVGLGGNGVVGLGGDMSGMAGQSAQGDPGGSVGDVGAGNAGGGSGGDGGAGAGAGGGGGEKRGGFIDRALRKARAAGGGATDGQQMLESLMQGLRQKQMQGQGKLISAAGDDAMARRTLPVSQSFSGATPRLQTAPAPKLTQDNAMTAAQSAMDAGQSGQGLGETVRDMAYGSPTSNAPPKGADPKNTTFNASPGDPKGYGTIDSTSVGIANRLASHLVTKYGLTRDQAVGAVGGMGFESGNFKTLQEQPSQYNNWGQNRGGYGYAQWTGPRRDGFEQFTTNKNLDPSSYEANEGYMDHELDTSHKYVIPIMRQQVGVPNSTQAWQTHYEGMPADSLVGNPNMRGHLNAAAAYDSVMPKTFGQTTQSSPPSGPQAEADIPQDDTSLPAKRGGYIRRAPGGSAVDLSKAPSLKLQLLNKTNTSIPSAKRGGTIVDKALALTRRR
jgi:hypothetical protein